jgi:hypothetical protein
MSTFAVVACPHGLLHMMHRFCMRTSNNKLACYSSSAAIDQVVGVR